jgi:NADH-quinone oxidoreductase subunit A
MFETFYPILFLLAVAVVIAVAFTALSILLGKRTRMGKKGQPYECGIDPIGTTKDPVPVKYFMVAISFILFDIEVIFLLPWAVVSGDLGTVGLVSILVFVSVILVGWVYELGKGALKWD